MKKTFIELPNWTFELDEVSANVYKVVGSNHDGHRVSTKGLDLDEILEECKSKAHEIENETKT